MKSTGPALRRAGAQQGLTLIEVLVALVIMALLSLMNWRALDGLQRSQERLDAHRARRHQVERVLEQLALDLRARVTTEFAEHGWALPVAETERADAPDAPEPLFLPAGVLIRTQGAGGAVLEIVRRAAGRPGHWQRVQWRMGEDGLYRAQGEPGTRYPLPGPQDGVLVLATARGWAFRAWDPVHGWRGLPVPDSRPAPPARALEIELDLAGRRGQNVVVRQVLPFP